MGFGGGDRVFELVAEFRDEGGGGNVVLQKLGVGAVEEGGD